MAGKKQNMASMWKKILKNVDIDEPTSFLDHVYLGCTQRECKPNAAIIEQHTKMCQLRISAGATEKLPGCVVLRFGRTRSKMRWAILWIGKNDSGAILQSLAPLFGWSSIQDCKSSRKMDSGMRQTTSKADILHHANDFRQYCHVGNTAQHCRPFFSTLRLCWWSRRLNVNFRMCLVHFWKSNICTGELDVQETDFSFTFFFRIRSYFVGCWTSNGRVTCSCSLGYCDWGFTNKYRRRANHKLLETGSGSKIPNQDQTCWRKSKGWSIESSGSCARKHTDLSGRAQAAHFRR